VIEYKCKSGYRVRNGDYLRECDLNGKWTGRKPSCEPINCGEPPFVKNAIAAYNNTFFKSSTAYKCINDDYYINYDKSKINCLANGKWSDELPKCIEKNCSLDAKEYSKDVYTLISTTNQVN
jgi:CUB/sushi domain-containing protein